MIYTSLYSRANNFHWLLILLIVILCLIRHPPPPKKNPQKKKKKKKTKTLKKNYTILNLRNLNLELSFIVFLAREKVIEVRV